MKIRKITNIFLIILVQIWYKISAKETECVINGKKVVNIVDERFLSISVDPAMFFTALNSSFTESMEEIVGHLSPAFIRIAGPSTEFLEFSKDENHTSNSSKLEMTPTLWKSLNEWIRKMDLTPIYAINDKSNMWDLKPTLQSFLDVNNQMGFSCYWQLGYDCKSKSVSEYKEDLDELKRLLNSHSASHGAGVSKIIGANLQSCLSNKSPELIRRVFQDLEYSADAVVWEKQNANRDDLIYFSKSYIPIWTTVPKENGPTTFSSALTWTKQLGEAARNGYEVVFRQPRFYELFTDTPVFWVSLIYKNLMGQNVLEVRTNDLPNSLTNVYVHCTKMRGNYYREGSITIMVVNGGNFGHKTLLRVANAEPRLIEVQSYVITGNRENSTVAYLNNKRLDFGNLQRDSDFLKPRIEMFKAENVLNLNVPGKSIGFFVLPGAGISVCTKTGHEEENLEEETSREHYGSPGSFQELLKNIQNELETDRNYYEKPTEIPPFISTQFVKGFGDRQNEYGRESFTNKIAKNSILKKAQADQTKSKNDVLQQLKRPYLSQGFMDRNYLKKKAQDNREKRSKGEMLLKLRKHQPSKLLLNKKVPQKLTRFRLKSPLIKRENLISTPKNLPKLEIVFTERPASALKPDTSGLRKVELELTREEIRKILIDRAKSRISGRNLDITSSELDDTLTEAAKNFLKKRNDFRTRQKRNRLSNLRKSPLGESYKKIHSRRARRDINMRLLKLNTQQNSIHSRPSTRTSSRINYKPEVRATIGEPGQFPEEFFETEFVEEKSIPAPIEIYAGLEDSYNDEEGQEGYHEARPNMGDRLKAGERFVDERITFLTEADRVDSALEDENNYGVFHEEYSDVNQNARKSQLLNYNNNKLWRNLGRKSIQGQDTFSDNQRFMHMGRFKRNPATSTPHKSIRKKQQRKLTKNRNRKTKRKESGRLSKKLHSEKLKIGHGKKIKLLEKRLQKLRRINPQTETKLKRNAKATAALPVTANFVDELKTSPKNSNELEDLKISPPQIQTKRSNSENFFKKIQRIKRWLNETDSNENKIDDSYLNEIRKSGEVYSDGKSDFYTLKMRKHQKAKQYITTRITEAFTSSTTELTVLGGAEFSNAGRDSTTTEEMTTEKSDKNPEFVDINSSLTQQKFVDFVVNVTSGIFEGIFAKIAFYM